VEELLERISNGKLADDRRSAMQELEAAVAENRAAKLAFGAMGKQNYIPSRCWIYDVCVRSQRLEFIRCMGLFQVNAALLKTLSV